MVVERAVPLPTGGWGAPWPQAVEFARVFPFDGWALVGGLIV